MHRKKRNARKNQACPVTASEKLQVSDELAESPFLTEGQRGRAGGGRLGSGPKLATAGPTLGLPSLAANSEGRCGWPIPHYGGGGQDRLPQVRAGSPAAKRAHPPHPPPRLTGVREGANTVLGAEGPGLLAGPGLGAFPGVPSAPVPGSCWDPQLHSLSPREMLSPAQGKQRHPEGVQGQTWGFGG